MSPASQPSNLAAPVELGQLDRFHLQKILGEGAQGVVYLAFDPHLERQVAIKAIGSTIDNPAVGGEPGGDLRPGNLQTNDMQMLLREARMVSKFQHPNIVSIYEIGFIGAAPYLVLEYVAGPLLSRTIKANRSGAPLPLALSLIKQVISGLGYAHDHGIIHGDLKPANVLVTTTDIAKITDFGIARGIGEQSGEGLSGSPRYMAPEYITDNIMTPAADQFSAGLLLFQLLTGKHPVTGKDIDSIFAQITAAEFPPPSSFNDEIDPEIDAIVARALSPDPDQRFEHIGDFKLAIEEFETEQLTNLTLSKTQSRVDSLRTLRQRIRDQKDFPALSASITNMNSLFAGNQKNAPAIAAVIAKDIALTSKVMRIANSAYIPHAGGEITSLSHAVMMLGFSTVREIASSLMLIGLSKNGDNTNSVKEQLVRSLFSATLARKIAIRQGEKDVDSCYLIGMFYRLGKLLTCFHLPEQQLTISELISKGIDDEQAASNVLGYSYTEIGHEIAADWSLPGYLVESIQSLNLDADATNHADDDPANTGRVYGSLSNDITDLLATASPPASLRPSLKKLRSRYERHIDVSSDEIEEILDGSRIEFRKYCTILKIDTANLALINCLDHWEEYFPDPESADQAQTTGSPESPEAVAGAGSNKAMLTLTRGIQEINALLENGSYDFDDLIRKILATAYYGAGCQRVLLCRSVAQQPVLKARYAVGKKVKNILKQFHFPLDSTSSMFARAVTTQTDIVVGDLDVHSIQEPAPAWYQRVDPASSFILLPFGFGNKNSGLIYLDHPQAHYFDQLPAVQLRLLRDLRDLATQAYEERGTQTQQP